MEDTEILSRLERVEALATAASNASAGEWRPDDGPRLKRLEDELASLKADIRHARETSLSAISTANETSRKQNEAAKGAHEALDEITSAIVSIEIGQDKLADKVADGVQQSGKSAEMARHAAASSLIAASDQLVRSIRHLSTGVTR